MVEPWIVVPAVAGSSPVGHPILGTVGWGARASLAYFQTRPSHSLVDHSPLALQGLMLTSFLFAPVLSTEIGLRSGEAFGKRMVSKASKGGALNWGTFFTPFCP